jgi:hypothetical protein
VGRGGEAAVGGDSIDVNETLAQLKAVLNRFRNHFDRFQTGDPLPPSLATMVASVGLPSEVSTFYSHCDGLDTGLEDGVIGQLMPASDCLEVRECLSDEVRANLWPIRGDGFGDYDCVVLHVPTCTGAVVFWDHDVADRPSYLLAGSFISYLAMWADKLVTCYSPSGKLLPEYEPQTLDAWPWVGKPQREHPWPFNEDYLRACDDRAAELLRNPQVRSWLSGQGA